MLSSSIERDTAYQKIVSTFDDLTGKLDFPSHLQMQNATRTGTEFDVMTYFTVLQHLSMSDGYVLDYIYHFDGMGGYPILYARKADEPRYPTEQDYERVYGKINPGGQSQGFLNAVHIDGSDQGYFEFVVLSIMGPQFYLWWHAGYFDHLVVCTQETLEALLPDDVRQDLNNTGKPIPVSPTIRHTTKEVLIDVTTFTKWGGVYRERFTISKDFPHVFERQVIEHLLAYDCGFRF